MRAGRNNLTTARSFFRPMERRLRLDFVAERKDFSPYLLVFTMTCDCEYVARERRLSFWVVEVNDRAVVLD